ncbi:hypothetical protein GPA10_07190 [Streptomyces sp. p1417]|uniref:Uncharacterized protein n=1 Tax=Streptomyces typhae TaxID=2681492 RepID=A0A6L6WQN4_9ACTN|nr:hypothetical protein [Streptomyces typhae]MVO84565.1 hypothetical protein [Streptomyces typhae]
MSHCDARDGGPLAPCRNRDLAEAPAWCIDCHERAVTAPARADHACEDGRAPAMQRDKGGSTSATTGPVLPTCDLYTPSWCAGTRHVVPLLGRSRAGLDVDLTGENQFTDVRIHMTAW